MERIQKTLEKIRNVRKSLNDLDYSRIEPVKLIHELLSDNEIQLTKKQKRALARWVLQFTGMAELLIKRLLRLLQKFERELQRELARMEKKR